MKLDDLTIVSAKQKRSGPNLNHHRGGGGVKKNKHLGGNFESYLRAGLKDSDEMVFLHLKNAFDERNYDYLMKAINDVAEAKGKSALAAKAGITRQSLHKILTGKNEPGLKTFMSVIQSLNLRLSIERNPNAPQT